MRSLVHGLLLGVLLVSSVACQTAPSGKAALDVTKTIEVKPADATAVEFYRWYVKQVNDGGSPFMKAPQQLKEYVSASLWKTLQQTRGVEKDADYFLKAQDTLDDWATNISASPAKMVDGITRTIVTLGASAESKHRLALDMVQEDGTWKIRLVREAR